MIRPRTVVDTNVWLSAYYAPHGAPARVIQCWREHKIVLCMSEPLLQEYKRKFTAKFGGKSGELPPRIGVDFAAIKGALFVAAPQPFPGCVPGDPDDEKFVECAIAAQADYLVSGDKGLLACDGYRGVTVVKPADFARELNL